MPRSERQLYRDAPRRWRWLVRLIVLTVTAYAIALAAMHWADARALRLRNEKLAQLRAANIAASLEDLVGSTPLPDADNAVISLFAAEKERSTIPLGNMDAVLDDCGRIGRPPANLFIGTETFLRCAHTAARLQRTDIYQRIFKGTGTTGLSEARSVARALMQYSRVLAEQGKLDAALTELEYTGGIRDTVWHGPASLIQFLVGRGIASDRCRALRSEIAPRVLDRSVRIDPEDLRSLIHDLMDDDPPRRAWHDALIGERIFILSDPFGSFTTRGLTSPLLPPNLLALSMDAATPMLVDYFAAYEDAADNALLEPVHAPPLIVARRGMADRAAHALVDIVTPAIGHEVLFQHIMTERLTACVLAAALYIRDYGEPPVSLFDLVPDYLPSLPTDSFDKNDGYVQMRIVGLRIEFFTVDPETVGITRQRRGDKPDEQIAPLEFGPDDDR